MPIISKRLKERKKVHDISRCRRKCNNRPDLLRAKSPSKLGTEGSFLNVTETAQELPVNIVLDEEELVPTKNWQKASTSTLFQWF